MTNEFCQTEYDFTLLLGGISEITDDIAQKLDEAGCDDATLSQRSGRVYLSFSRRSTSMKNAIMSAIQDVLNADVGATIDRIDECSLVTQADIARRIGRTRQLVNQYINGLRGPGYFPPPACNIVDGVPLWYWCEVAYWLFDNNLIKEEDLRDAQEVAAINRVLEFAYQRRTKPELTNEVVKYLLD